MLWNKVAALIVVALAWAQAAAAETPPHWELRSSAEGGLPCRAVLRGGEVNLQLMRNREGRIVLAGSHATWEESWDARTIELSLAVDANSPVQFKANPMGPVLFVLIENAAFEQQLRKASLVQWRLPWGTYTGQAAGLGEAFDAIAFCPE